MTVTEDRVAAGDIAVWPFASAGCAIPLGSKICDVCRPVPALAPQAQVWQALVVEAGPPVQFASTSAAWTAAPRPITVATAPKAGFWMRGIWVAFDANKQGWHVKIAGTYVVTSW
jgi:hypothetical protein